MHQVTELLWQDAMRHLGSTNNEILLPTNVIDLIGQDNVDKIKARLCALIRAPVVAFIDESINALRIMRRPAFAGSATSAASHVVVPLLTVSSYKDMASESRTATPKIGTPAKTAKIPRPPNAFILYRQHHHPRVKEAHPDFHNNEISIMLGKQWKEEPADVKAHFKALADEIKRKHAADYPDYQYAPRKPSEKKRRSTSRNISTKGQRNLRPLPEASSSVPSAISAPTEQSGLTIRDIDNIDPMNDILSFNAALGVDTDYENAEFDSEEFDAMIQRVQDDHDRVAFHENFNLTSSGPLDTLHFSDFIVDYY
ncbi:hypothetical protein VTN02DRAFT_6634 [Thermoascus thermophilus]